MSKLVEPSSEYLDGNIEFLKELLDEGEITKEEYDTKIALRKNIGTYLESLSKLDKDDLGLHVYWLVDNDVFIGTFRLNERLNDKQRKGGGNIGYEIRPSKHRQGYGTEILRLGLLKAKELGMKEILINCREDNTASRKIIENNGGVFIKSVPDESGDPNSLWYKIKI